MRIGQPGVFLVVAGCFIGSLAFSLLMVVMRGLLTRAAALHSELAEVV